MEQLGPVQRFPGGVHVLRVRMPKGLRLSGHRHDDPVIVVVLEGSLDVVEGATTWVEHALTVRLCPRASQRTVTALLPTDCLIVSCGVSHVARHRIWKSLTAGARFQQPSAVRAFIDRVSSAERAEESAAETACLDLLSALAVPEAEQRTPEWLADALVSLAESRGRRGACAAVARQLGVHPVHLNRVVRRFTGLTAREFVRRERALAGSRLLRSSAAAIGQIAHEAGFSDQSHFCREFALRHGCSPRSDREGDVASVQATEFPAVHLGEISTDRA